MTRQIIRLIRRSAWAAVLLLPVGVIVIAAASAAGADTQLPQPVGISASPAQGSTNGQQNVTVGAPGGQSGGSVGVRPCTSPCIVTVTQSHGPEPAGVGLTSGQGASGSGDDSPAASAGAPPASGNGQAGKQSSANAGPSGGSYQSSGCVSVVSLVPVPLPINGTGNTCPNSASGVGGSGSGNQAAANGGSGGGGSAGSAGSAAGNGGVATLCPAAPAGLRIPQPSGPAASALELLVVALVALATGYLLSATRRRFIASP